MCKVPWNRVIYNEFVSLTYLTPEEEEILQTRIAGWSQVKQCTAYNMSLATLNRKIKRMKDKYESVQPYSEQLPKNLDF